MLSVDGGILAVNKQTLIENLKTSLADVAQYIDGKEEYLINIALDHFTRLCPNIATIELQIKKDIAVYDTPDDFVEFVKLIWAHEYQHSSEPWSSDFISHWPEYYSVDNKIHLSIKPSSAQILAAGTQATLFYNAKRTVESLSEFQAHLVVLRAMAEAMRLESVRKSNKPVQLRDGHSPGPKNSTPSALYQAFLQEFREGCRG